MRLKTMQIPDLAHIEIAPLEIEISGDEILADLLYPSPGESSAER